MNTSYYFILILIFFSILISLESALFLFTRHKTFQGKLTGFLLIGQSSTLIFYILQWFITAPKISQLIFIFQVLGYILFTIFWLMFIFAFTQHLNWIKTRILAIILAFPLTIIGLLVYYWILGPEIYPTPEQIGSLFLSPFLGNLAKMLLIIYSNGISLISTVILLNYYAKSDLALRKTIIPLIIGPILLYIIGIFEILGNNPISSLPLFEIAIACISFLTFFIIFDLRFRNVKTFARATVVGQMRDGVLILDKQLQIVDINTAAQKIINPNGMEILNQPLSQVWPIGADRILSVSNEDFLEGEIVAQVNGLETTFDFNNSQLLDEYHEKIGRVIVLHNVTGRERMEQALNERSDELERTNKILSALAEITVSIQTGSNQDQFYEILGTEIRKLNMFCFIAQLEPATNDLKINFISALPEILKKVEKTLKMKVIGFQLSRRQFAPFYYILESKTIGFEIHKDGDFGSGYRLDPDRDISWALRNLGIQSEFTPVMLPLFTSGRDIGVMGIWGENILESDIPALKIFASQIAHVLEKVIVYQAEIEKSAELLRSSSLVSTLSKVSSILQTTSNSDVVLETLGKEIKKVGLNCFLIMFDQTKETAFIRYSSLSPKLIQEIEKITGLRTKKLAIPKYLWPEEWKQNEQNPVWYPNPEKFFRRIFPKIPQAVGRILFKLMGIKEDDVLCMLPLINGREMVGAMPIWGPGLKSSDNLILTVFSNQVSGIMRNISNYEDELSRANRLALSNAIIMALSNVASLLETTSNLSEVYEILGRELKKIQINCMVGTLDESKQFMKIEYLSILNEISPLVEKFDAFWPKEVIIPRNLWPTDKAVTEKSPFWDPDPIGNTSKMFPHIPKQIFQNSFKMAGMNLEDQVCYLPMISEEDVIGIFAVWGPAICQDDIPGLSVFVNQVTTAIKNTRLFNQAQKEIVERTMAESRVRESLNEKEVLLKEVHHRVKNNLQVISSLLNLQIAQSPDSDLNEGLRESQNRVRAMGLIHEKLYQSENLARINFSSYLHSLTNALVQTYRINPEKIAILIEAESMMLDLDTAIPCGLIVNELVSNSLKYAFPDGKSGCIKVICQKGEFEKYTLVVEDNGIGLPDGFAPTKTSSLGLKLVTSLARQIDGELVIDGKNGSRFEISFSGD